MSLRRCAVVLVTLAAVVTGSRPATAAPQPMTRAEIIDLAKSVVGYSYWWGHGAWRNDGAQPGSCSGSCPSCSHSGSYGADCSGFAAKAWQVPGPSPVATDAHPYSTYNFRYETTHWTKVAREATRQGDALVYNSSGSGHIVVYESGDPWGSMWAYECKGCSYGCVRNLRTVTSSYVAIQRNGLTETQAEGTLQGVVYAGTDTAKRIPGATVTLAIGATATARDPDAYWSFTLAPGYYTVTAAAAGYAPRSRTCTITAGTAEWCSIGLTSTSSCTPDCSGRQCGPDPLCGQSCGTCAAGDPCDAAGHCATPCIPDCAGRACGPDPRCGQSCGSCAAGGECDGAGQCQACLPDCTGLVCGPDPRCGEQCGSCPGDLSCNLLGQCEQLSCVPDCSGRACGPDPLCGQSCAICPAARMCDPTGQCRAVDPTRGKLFGYAVVQPAAGNDLFHAPHVPNAAITLDVGATIWADRDGYYELEVVPGTHTLTASAVGMAPGSQSCSVAAGGYSECPVPLSPFAGGEEGNADTLRGGCAAAPGAPSLLAVALLPLVLARRRRR